jgi:PEP-CTERM motif
MRFNNLAGMFFAVALATPSAWAGITSCASSASGNTLSSFGATSSANGCAAVDITFESLSLTGASQTGHGTDPTISNISVYSSSNNFYVDGFADINGSGSEKATVGFEAVGGTNGNFHAVYESLTLQANGIDLSRGSTVSITENFCLNSSQALVGGNCTAADHGTITALYTSSGVSYSCAFGTAGVCLGSASNEVTFSGFLMPLTSIAISEAVNINSTNWVQMSNIDNVFQVQMESPEPASMALVGVALAGLAAITYRKRAGKA